MDCKFLKHGLAISYDNVIKPCCEWQVDSSWSQQQISNTNLVTWHQSRPIQDIKTELDQGVWPAACKICQTFETAGRGDSLRLSGNRAYQNYSDQDITLEIRPGNTCNFACQSCWPEASSRVASFYSQAGLIQLESLDTTAINDFEFLLPVAKRIQNVVLLGGEPFYDKNCQRFLVWAQEHLTADLTLFTNGSYIDFDFIKAYSGKLVIVFSLDAVGRPAEYIRYGTNWPTIADNFERLLKFTNVEVRVNITTTVYNFVYLESLLEYLIPKWPSLVTFGRPRRQDFQELVVPADQRNNIIKSLTRAQGLIKSSQIESGQKQNAINALDNIIKNLKEPNYSLEVHKQLIGFIEKMDQVKKISISDFCPELALVILKKVN